MRNRYMATITIIFFITILLFLNNDNINSQDSTKFTFELDGETFERNYPTSEKDIKNVIDYLSSTVTELDGVIANNNTDLNFTKKELDKITKLYNEEVEKDLSILDKAKIELKKRNFKFVLGGDINIASFIDSSVVATGLNIGFLLYDEHMFTFGIGPAFNIKSNVTNYSNVFSLGYNFIF